MSNDCGWHWNLETDTVVWSDGLEEITGIPAGTRPGSFGEFIDLIHPDDRQLVRSAVHKAISEDAYYDVEFRITTVCAGRCGAEEFFATRQAAATAWVAGQADYAAEFRLTDSDGSLRWVSDRGRLRTDNDGQRRRVVGTLVDITARKQAEEDAQNKAAGRGYPLRHPRELHRSRSAMAIHLRK